MGQETTIDVLIQRRGEGDTQKLLIPKPDLNSTNIGKLGAKLMNIGEYILNKLLTNQIQQSRKRGETYNDQIGFLVIQG